MAQHRIVILVLLLLGATLIADESHAAVTNFTQVYAIVRVATSNPGEFENKPVLINCSGTAYTGTDGKAGCAGEKYDYSKVTTLPTWPQTVGGTNYTAADNQRFWDWIYSGYGGGGACDWSQNCHGYAFGVGDWPTSSSTIIQGGATQCWVQDASNATIADRTGHTVKITMKDCQNSLGLIVETSSEQFKESGTYTQAGNCDLQNGGSVDLGKGASDASVGVNRGGMTFDLYKKP